MIDDSLQIDSRVKDYTKNAYKIQTPGIYPEQKTASVV